MRERWEGQMEVASGANHLLCVCIMQNWDTFFFQMLRSSFLQLGNSVCCMSTCKKKFTQDDLRQFSCFDWSKLTKEPFLEDQTA